MLAHGLTSTDGVADMSTFSYVGPKEGEKIPMGELKVTLPPVQVSVPPLDWQPLLDAIAASQERAEYKVDSMVAAIDELAINLKFPAPNITVTPQISAPVIEVDARPNVKVEPQVYVQPSEIIIRWPKGLILTAYLNLVAMLLVAFAIAFQIYLRLK